MIDNWLDSCESFHQQYIIMPTESYDSYVPEEVRYIVVTTPQSLINQ